MVLSSVFVLAVLCGGGEALAQQTASVDRLTPETLPKAVVLDKRGGETSGRLLAIDTEAVVLLVKGRERRFELRQVDRVTTTATDSLKNGAAAGAVVGVVIGSLKSRFLARNLLEASGVVAVYTGLYAAIGTGLDAANVKRTVVYGAPTDGPGPSRSAGPSIVVRIRW